MRRRSSRTTAIFGGEVGLDGDDLGGEIRT